MKRGSIIGLVLVVAAFTIGAEGCGEREAKTQRFEQQFTEDNQARLIAVSPPPQLDTSLERENLKRRLVMLNDRDKEFYIYLVSFGKVMAFYVAKGKVSSVNSKLTTGEQIICPWGRHCSESAKVVESPQLDGSYGTNGDGIFFFTTEGAYVEWNGRYMVSDFPLKLSTPPELVRMVTN